MPIPPITVFAGTYPDIGDPVTFDARMSAWQSWIDGFDNELDAVVTAMNIALNDNGTVLDTAGEAIALTTNANTPTTTTGTAAAYLLAAPVTVTAYADGQTFLIRAHAANSASPTLAVDGLAALPIQKRNQAGTLVGLDASDFIPFELHLVTVAVGGTVLELASTPINDILDEVAVDAGTTTSATRPWTVDAVKTYVAAASVTQGTPQVTTSGTEKDFINIPAGVNAINIKMDEIGIAGSTENVLVQIGDSGGIETVGYVSASAHGSGSTSATDGFVVLRTVTTHEVSGILTLRRLAAGSSVWVSSHSCFISSGISEVSGGGRKQLSGELTQIRVKTALGGAFSNGSVNIDYE